jgi:hypothetical protein
MTLYKCKPLNAYFSEQNCKNRQGIKDDASPCRKDVSEKKWWLDQRAQLAEAIDNAKKC